MEVAAIPNEILPLGSPLIALFSLVPLYIALFHAKSCRESFHLMALQSLTVHIGSSFWLANFRDFAVFTLGASALGTALEGGLMGMLFFLYPSFTASRPELEENAGIRPFALPARMLWFTAVWVTWEWFKSTGFLGYPWGTLFLAAYRWKLFTQIAAVTGVWGVTFLYALFSTLVAEGIMLFRRTLHSPAPQSLCMSYRQSVRLVTAFFCVCGIYGLCTYLMPRLPVKQLTAVIVQQNVDPWEGGSEKSIEISKRLTEQKINSMREQNMEPDLVVWSEGVLNRAFPNARFYYYDYPEDESLGAFIHRMGVPFIIGGETLVNQEKKHYQNSAIFFDARGIYAGFYSKMHLVPFAEAIPFSDNELVRQLMKRMLGFSAGWMPGRQLTLFRIPAGKRRNAHAPIETNLAKSAVIRLDMNGQADTIATEPYITGGPENLGSSVSFTTPICFEDAFPDVCRGLFDAGSELFMNITNDSWSRTKSAEYQHFAAASYLALEFRTTLVRCANAGYTVALDPAGRIIDDLPLFQEGAMGIQIPVYERSRTYFAAHGDWLVNTVLACMALATLCMAYSLHAKDSIRRIFAGSITITFTPGGNK